MAITIKQQQIINADTLMGEFMGKLFEEDGEYSNSFMWKKEGKVSEYWMFLRSLYVIGMHDADRVEKTIAMIKGRMPKKIGQECIENIIMISNLPNSSLTLRLTLMELPYNAEIFMKRMIQQKFPVYMEYINEHP